MFVPNATGWELCNLGHGRCFLLAHFLLVHCDDSTCLSTFYYWPNLRMNLPLANAISGKTNSTPKKCCIVLGCDNWLVCFIFLWGRFRVVASPRVSLALLSGQNCSGLLKKMSAFIFWIWPSVESPLSPRFQFGDFNAVFRCLSHARRDNSFLTA